MNRGCPKGLYLWAPVEMGIGMKRGCPKECIYGPYGDGYWKEIVCAPVVFGSRKVVPPWRLVLRRSSRVFQKECAVPPSRLVVEMSFFFFFFFSGVVLGPTGVVHLRTLRGRTCNFMPCRQVM